MREHDLLQEHSEQREIVKYLLEPQPTVIGIEGGPCSGKTTLINRLQASAGDRKIVCLPEAASQHITALAEKGVSVADIAQNDRPAWVQFEVDVLATIVEDIETARQLYEGTDAIIVADRCDIGAYVTDDEHRAILSQLGLELAPMLSHIDQLYFLPSVARIDAATYEAQKAGNAARYESLTAAQETCQRNLEAVSRHPELHIAWGGDFETTIDRLVGSILDPEGESEVKLKPTESGAVAQFFQDGDVVSRAAIEQTYYELDGNTFRLRRTVTERGEELYAFTVKSGEGIHRREVQRRLDRATFELLGQCPRVGEPLVKERSMVLTEEQGVRRRVWAIDRYFDRRLPEWNIETDVETDEEAECIRLSLPEFEPALLGAEKLARSLGSRALSV